MIQRLLNLRVVPALVSLLIVACDDADTVEQGELFQQEVSPVSPAPVTPAELCGDAAVSGTEECEPPGTATCDASCRRPSTCGNGAVDAGEQCDDGNRLPGDGCSSRCLTEGCGNGRLDPGESCERPNQPRCNALCQSIEGRCGDGVLDSGEQCEDGDAEGGDGCSPQCQDEVCGNGRVDSGETCEPPGSATCDRDCQIEPGLNPRCGDRVKQAGEECEDGNTRAGDGCSPACLFEACGNRRLDPDELCEPPGTALCDSRCLSILASRCGDGQLDPGESCDDENRLAGDGCSELCEIERCGNSRVDSGEDCEPPGTQYCNPGCRLTVYGCGNGVLDPSEECEDGNTIDGDGCDRACLRESCGNGRINPGEQCELPNTPRCDALCQSIVGVCGNGRPEAGEECDDGNRVFGDGCNRRCEREVCGNRRVEHVRECEPPGSSSCDATCRPLVLASCGDGQVSAGEECEDGNQLSGDGCSAVCLREQCGNRRLDWAEECEPPGSASCNQRCRSIARPAEGGVVVGPPPVLLVNGEFDRDVSGWAPRVGAASVAFNAASDASGVASSGSARVTLEFRDTTAGEIQGGISQCVAVSPGTAYQLGARYLIESTAPASTFVTLRVTYHSEADCGGSQLGLPLQGPAAAVREVWSALAGLEFEVPAAGRSARVFVELRKAFADAPARVLLDQIRLTRAGRVTRCGDGLLDAGESCEPALLSNCTSDCQLIRVCGDNIVTAPEECDPPNGTTCGGECFSVRGFCGNSLREAAEQCDPPNGATCGLSCTNIQCGNGVTEAPEQCDSPDRALCSAACRRVDAACGDGLVQGVEQCDPPDPRTLCSEQCRISPAACGNGILERGEECDPTGAALRCDPNCKRSAWCGDGKLEGIETCEPPDGIVCGDDCQVFPGKQCEGCLLKECGDPSQSADLFSACFRAEGNATAGPAAGHPRNELCADAVDCMATSGCASEGIISCYCGRSILDANGVPIRERVRECIAGTRQADGECLEQFERAGESVTRRTIAQHIADPGGNTALNAAAALLACGVEPRLVAGVSVLGDCYVANACLVVPACGNAIQEPGEECDAGSSGNAACSASCKKILCGNGKLDSGEQCDPLDPLTNQRCNEQCRVRTVCGDGRTEGSEECDPADLPLPAGAVCCAPQTPTCQACTYVSSCGNGTLEYPEQCEPANTATCDAACVEIDESACATCTLNQPECAEWLELCQNGPGPLFQNSCRAVGECIERTNCAKVSSAVCYCGDLDLGGCLGATETNGDCAAVLLANTGNTSRPSCNAGPSVYPSVGQCVLGRQNDDEYGSGVQFQIVNCQRNFCAAECGLDP